MSFQPPASTPSTGPGFSFGLTTSTPAAAKPPSFSFGATGGGDAGTTKPLTFGVAAPAIGTTAAAPTATVASGLGGGGAFLSATPTATVQPSVAATTGAAAAPNFNFGAAPVATTTAVAATLPMPKTTVPSLGLAAAPITSAPAAAAPVGGGFTNLSTATKTTDSAAVAHATHMSYNQLEEHINKWTLELEDQEKVFTDQATQINAWDKILINNNQKILELNDAVQKVKSDQQTLEQELEFIATQHKELEESIVPLQKEFMKIPQVDVERSQTYLMVENLDTQLKQMSEDLKEIIDNLNEANKSQDNTDPIIQIGKILNAHMSSLQWIEQSSANITNKLDDITKMHESFKRDSERSFRSAYYN